MTEGVDDLVRAPNPTLPSDEKQAQHLATPSDRTIHRKPVARFRAQIPSDPDGERRVRVAIEDAALRNSELLATLAATEDAVSAAQNTERRLVILESEIKRQEKAVRRVSTVSQAEYDRHRSYRNAIGRIRKMYYAVTGMRARFDGEAMEAEETYFRALREKAHEEGREEALKRDLEGIEQESKVLSVTVKEHAAAHRDLDNLYQTIFAGPTPGFPDEDDREITHKRKIKYYTLATQRLVNVVTARKKVEQISRTITLAREQVSAAMEEIEEAIFSYNGALVWLSRCAEILQRGLQLCDEAYKTVQGPVDAKFRNSHSTLHHNLRLAQDLAMNARISETFDSSTEATDVLTQCFDRLDAATHAQEILLAVLHRWEDLAEQALKGSARSLEDSRQALAEIRQAAFEATVGYGAAAPAYRECCDRAATFEGDAHAQCQRVTEATVDETVRLPPPPSYERDSTGHRDGDSDQTRIPTSAE